MELTPIKVPGKRKRKPSKNDQVARNAVSRRPGGRLKPLKQLSSTVESLPVTTHQPRKRSLKHLKSRRKMSLLEKLPTELLETVFLHCLNFELPRSSPVLGGRLSSSLMYTRILMAVFGPTWNAWHGIRRNRRTQPDSSGDPRLQSAVLRCRWATLDVLLNAKDTWIQRFGDSREIIPLYFSRDLHLKTEELQSLAMKPRSTKEYFEIDFAGFVEFSKEIDGPSVWHTCDWERNTDVSDGIQIPESLLQAPWTEDKLRYLFWLVKSGAELDWVTSTSGEVATSGLQAAILGGNIRAVHLLHWAGLITKLDTDTLIFAIRNSGGDKLPVVNHILRLGFNILSDPDARMLGRAMAELRDEAVHESDKEKLQFFHSLRRSTTLRDVTNLHV